MELNSVTHFSLGGGGAREERVGARRAVAWEVDEEERALDVDLVELRRRVLQSNSRCRVVTSLTEVRHDYFSIDVRSCWAQAGAAFRSLLAYSGTKMCGVRNLLYSSTCDASVSHIRWRVLGGASGPDIRPESAVLR